MTIEDTLLHRFGPLLSLAQLAAILDRSPDGLRISLRTTNEWAQRINKARLKIGRRVYFRTSQVAEVLGGESLS
ncbi:MULTISPECIES: DNA-binding protein [Chromobacterium]|uniref:DNA-binding protein n=1 Tax=Chromobacterium TaxID=535 RepID=UPI0018871286|nr:MULTISPECIES: DNA-binding protein [Chromobacterium]QOZ85213.1 DNA-binding protein [Chromobacterium sp. Rain0013]WON85421.1 DNA-binding protein [Chromobacterium haemolyticum]